MGIELPSDENLIVLLPGKTPSLLLNCMECTFISEDNSNRVINFNIRLKEEEEKRQLLAPCRVHGLSFLRSYSEDFIAPCLYKLCLTSTPNGFMADWDTFK